LVTNQQPEVNVDAFDDLSGNVPGASLRKKSSDIKRASPGRVFLAKILGVHTDERAWRRGAAGEEEVARQLEKLGPSWRVIHSVPVGSKDTDIDHVVIGPPGVFTLNTKNHLGKRVTVYEYAIYVGGMKQPYLSKSRAEGKRGSKILSSACGFGVVVHPVVVIMADELVVKGSPHQVDVVGRRKVSEWLDRHPAHLSSDRIEAIYAVARRRLTWAS
jgi:Nuclease-related domain